MDNKPYPSIRDLYPHLSEAELIEAEDNFRQYLTAVLRIFERLQAERHDSTDKLTPPPGTLFSSHRGPKSSK